MGSGLVSKRKLLVNMQGSIGLWWPQPKGGHAVAGGSICRTGEIW